MTIADAMLIIFSAIVIPGLYLLGRWSRKAHREDAAKKDNR